MAAPARALDNPVSASEILLSGASGGAVRFARDDADALLRPGPPVRDVLLDNETGLFQLFDENFPWRAVAAAILGNSVGMPQPNTQGLGGKSTTASRPPGFKDSNILRLIAAGSVKW